MKLNLVVDLELSDADLPSLCADSIDFLQSHLKLQDCKDSVCAVLDVTPLEDLSLSKMSFSEKLVTLLNQHHIYYLHNMCKYTNLQLFHILTKSFSRKDAEHFLRIIRNEMKRHNLCSEDDSLDAMRPLWECGMSARTVNSLTKYGYIYIQDMASYSRQEVARTRNFGKKCQEELEAKMIEYGVCYADS